MNNFPTLETEKTSHLGHNLAHSHTSDSGINHHEGHSGHSESEAENTIATLTVPDQITPNTSVPLVIEVQDKKGRTFSDSQTVITVDKK